MSAAFGAGHAFFRATQRVLVRLPTFTRSLTLPFLHFTGFFFFFFFFWAVSAEEAGSAAWAAGVAATARLSRSARRRLVRRKRLIHGLVSDDGR